MASYCAPQLDNLCLYSFEAKLKEEKKTKNKHVFDFPFGYIDDILSINNNNIYLLSFKCFSRYTSM